MTNKSDITPPEASRPRETAQRNRLRTALRALLTMIALAACALRPAATYAQMPSPTNPPRLVNDFAKLMNATDAQALEDSLVRFDRRTSTQVTVITISDLDGYDIAEYAQEIGEKWGVGRKGKDNGVVILVKPKTADGRGRAFIGTGYGVEGALPDVTCTRIVNEVMIPHFKDGDYSGGITAGAVAVMKAVDGEFESEDEDSAGPVIALFMAVIFFGLVAFIIMVSDGKGGGNGNGNGHVTRSSGVEWLMAGSLLSSGKSSGGGWSGGSFGGFGGFGGGSFGGGGGGGSW